MNVEAIVLFLQGEDTGLVADQVELVESDRRTATFQVTFPLPGAPVVQAEPEFDPMALSKAMANMSDSSDSEFDDLPPAA